MLVSMEDQLLRWKEHFEEVLNISRDGIHLVEIPNAPTLKININQASLNEICEAIKSMKNRKASGADIKYQLSSSNQMQQQQRTYCTHSSMIFGPPKPSHTTGTRESLSGYQKTVISASATTREASTSCVPAVRSS
ncbi:unnamed protein product [Diamesa hyperborea]